MTIGPSFLYGLWGVSNDPGYRTLSSTVAPSNAFLFVTRGAAFNASYAQWAPTFGYPTGAAPIAFPNHGNYYFEWLLSDYRPFHRSLNRRRSTRWLLGPGHLSGRSWTTSTRSGW